MSGFERAAAAAWEYLPQVIITSIVALIVFVGGLWLDFRDVRSVIGHVEHEQSQTQLCRRVSECSVCTETRDRTAENHRILISAENHIDSHDKESAEWKRRIIVLEQKVYNIQTTATGRHDPATGTMLRSLEEKLTQEINELRRNNQ